MDISGEHHFRAPREIVWQLLLDPAALEAAIPGCERFEPVADDTYDVTIRVGIAALRGSYSGRVTIEDRREGDSYRLGVSGSGQPGSVQGDALLTLTESGGRTTVRYKGDLRAQGGLARAGGLVLSGAAKLLIGQFFKGMDRQVAAHT